MAANKNKNKKTDEIQSLVLSEDEQAKLIFKNNPTAFLKYKHVRMFSRLNHEQTIKFVKKLFNISP